MSRISKERMLFITNIQKHKKIHHQKNVFQFFPFFLFFGKINPNPIILLFFLFFITKKKITRKREVKREKNKVKKSKKEKKNNAK